MADVSSVDLGAIEPPLRQLVDGEISATAGGFHVAATLTRENARDFQPLAALRAPTGERRTRLRATWTADGIAERFFDYVPKGPRSGTP